jgi:hypothetical protein
MEMRTSENYNNSFHNEDGTRNTESYNDSFVREKMAGGVHGILFEHFGWELTEGDFMGIDCKFANDPTRGVELEQGGWDGPDFWEHNYSKLFLKDLGYQTVNFQIRKLKYWMNDELNVKHFLNEQQTKWEWVKQPNLLNKQDTIYCRTNVELTNFIIIPPELVLNKKYEIRERYAHNSKRIESWCCLKREDVKSYKLINGILIKY